MQGRIASDITFTRNGKQRLSFELDGDFRRQYDALKDADLEITVKKYRKERSLEQNRYAWELIGKIADKMRANKDDIYLLMLKRYGQGGVIKVQPQKEELILSILKYYEPHEKLYSGEDKYYRVWAGSSGYNTEEMTVFIDGIISEAKALGIETMTPEQLAELRSLEATQR